MLLLRRTQAKESTKSNSKNNIRNQKSLEWRRQWRWLLLVFFVLVVSSNVPPVRGFGLHDTPQRRRGLRLPQGCGVVRRQPPAWSPSRTTTRRIKLFFLFGAESTTTSPTTATSAQQQQNHPDETTAGDSADSLFAPSSSSALFGSTSEENESEDETTTTTTFATMIASEMQEAREEFSASLENMTLESQMVSMTVLGTSLSVGVLAFLAWKTVEGQQDASGAPILAEAADSILEAAIPLTPTDVVTVALGESLAGLIAACAAIGLALVMGIRRNQNNNNNNYENNSASSPTTSTTDAVVVADAVADGDFLVTQAAVLPLFEVIGFPLFFATAASIAFALIPYQVVRAGTLKRQRLDMENQIMEELLEDQQAEERLDRIQSQPFPYFSLPFSSASSTSSFNSNSNRRAVDPSTLKPVQVEDMQLDSVDIFCDTTKWLEYGILQAEFGGTLTMLPPGMESAVFGILATLSAQVYAYFLYTYFGIGNESRRNAIRSRTASDWVLIYISRTIYAAFLFGIYDLLQTPVTAWIAELLSGARDSCSGSPEYQQCIEAFLANNSPPPEASPEAEFRGVVTYLASVFNRFVEGWLS